MGELRRGISSKITDAPGVWIDRLGKLRRTHLSTPFEAFPMGPILAEEAVKGAPVVKDCKVFEPIFRTRSASKPWKPRTRSSRTDPVCHTVGGQRIVIPTESSTPFRRARKLSGLISSQATISLGSLWNLTLIHTNVANHTTLAPGRNLRKLKRFS